MSLQGVKRRGKRSDHGKDQFRSRYIKTKYAEEQNANGESYETDYRATRNMFKTICLNLIAPVPTSSPTRFLPQPG
jgi:hypothetical protein